MSKIEVTNLQYIYDPRKTDGIKNLSFSIPMNQVTAIVGPSGSGKSTTLKCLASIINDFKGEISFPEQLEINYLNQNGSLESESRTVFEYLDSKLSSKISDPDKRNNQIRATLLDLELTNEIESIIQELSAGQQQRVYLASSLIFNPGLLLLDEPFANLDPLLRKQLLQDFFNILKDRDTTILMVTHSTEEALAFGKQIIILNHGELQQIGTPQEVYFYPKNIFVANFIADSNVYSAQVKSISSEKIDIQILNQIFEISFSSKMNNLQTGDYIFVHILKEDIRLNQKSKIKGPIQEIYFLGAKNEIHLKINNQQIKAFTSNKESYHQENIVYISFNPDDIYFISKA